MYLAGVEIGDMLQWRAGHVPGLTPRQRTEQGGISALRRSLQWRAGHVPGLTSMTIRGLVAPGRTPLAPMEGRARARPDPKRSPQRAPS